MLLFQVPSGVPTVQQHLLIRVEDKGKPFDSVESIIHNRMIPLTEILGAMTETSFTEGSRSTFFKMKLITSAETYPCQFLHPGGPLWLKQLQDLVSFAHIPQPIENKNENSEAKSEIDHLDSISSVVKRLSRRDRPRRDSQSSSGSAASSYSPSNRFNASRQVIEYISKLQTQASIPNAPEIASILVDIFTTVPDVKSNRSVAGRFAKKMETVVVTLCHKETGIINSASHGFDLTLLQFHLSSLRSRLNSALGYLRSQSSPGWLEFSMTLEGSAMFQYKDLYNNIINIVNNMTVTLLKSEPTLKPIYESAAVDVLLAVQSTGE